MLPLLAALLAAQADHPWARHAPGTSVTYRTTVRFGDSEIAASETWTLSEVNGTHAVVSISGDQAPSRLQRLPLTAPECRDLGTETLQVEGRSFLCAIRRLEQEGVTTTSWTCADAPGGVVRSVSTGAGQESTTRLVKLSDPQQVAGRQMDCWLLETVSKAGGAETIFRTWNSAGVPGLQVRTEASTRSARGLTQVARAVESFSIK